MNRRHQYKTLRATVWELVVFAAKVAAVTVLVVGWALVFYRTYHGN